MYKLELSSSIGKFRLIAILEGVSYLLLLCLAMPLKYFAGNLFVIKYMGWAHGILFLAYCILLLKVWSEYSWKFSKVFFAFCASLLPFGTFYLEKTLKKKGKI